MTQKMGGGGDELVEFWGGSKLLPKNWRAARENARGYPIFASFSPKFWGGCRPSWKILGGGGDQLGKFLGVELKDRKNGGGRRWMTEKMGGVEMRGRRPRETAPPPPPQGVFGTFP